MRSLFQSQPDIQVVGEAGNFEDGLEALELMRPDVVIMDLDLGDVKGADVMVALRGRAPDAIFIAHTAAADEWLVLEVVRHGIDGFVLKVAPSDTLCEAVRVTSSGGVYLDPVVASMVSRRLIADGRIGPAQVDTELTGRERWILRGIAEGKRNRDIATELSVSERTVKHHVTCMLAKLGAKTRIEAVKIALKQQLVDL